MIGRTEQGSQELTTRLENRARVYGVEISTNKSKAILSSGCYEVKFKIMANCEKTEVVASIKLLGAPIPIDGSSREVTRARIELVTAGIQCYS